MIRPLLFSLALLLAACGDSPTGCEPDCGPVGDEIVAGVNLTELYAAPRFAEIDAARDTLAAALGGRTVTPGLTVSPGDREVISVLEGDRTEGGPVFTGTVRQPPREAGDQRRRPLLVVLWDEPNLGLDRLIADLPLDESLLNEFVLLVVVRRGGSLQIGGTTVGTRPSALDPFAPEHVGDALALVEYVRQRRETYGVREGAVGILGYGRGGTTGLNLRAIADTEALTVALAAPASFQLPSVRETTSAYLRGVAYDAFPGLNDVLALTAGEVRDGAATIDEARVEGIVRSPALLTEETAPGTRLYIAHGQRDTVVPEEHGRTIGAFAAPTGGGYLAPEEATHESLPTNPEVRTIVRIGVCDTLLAGESVCD